MKKKKDMITHLHDAKTVSGIFRIPRRFVLTLFIFTSSYSQQYINDFCYYSRFNASPGFNKIVTTDFSQDKIPDLLLISGNDKQVVEFQGNAKTILDKKSDKFFFFTITDLTKLLYKKGNDDLYFFLSRKDGLGGLVSFTKYGTLQLLNKITFNTNPDRSIIGDINNDGENEIVVFGSNFDGLVSLQEKNYVLQSEQLIGGKSFSEAAFINLDYDEAIDIVAFDYLKAELVFLYNEDEGVFYENRTLTFDSDVTNLKAIDFNKDGYDDLVFLSDRGINFFIGDSVSSFEQRKILYTDSPVIDFVTGDFNNDKMNDLAYITDQGQLFIAFGQTNDSFSPPVLYLQKENLVDIHFLSIGKKKYLYLLSESGYIYCVSNYHEKENYSLALSVNPSDVNFFDYSDSYNKDLFYVDEYDSKIKVLLRGLAGGFEKYFEFPIEDNFQKVVVSVNQKPLTTFYCYSPDKKLLERIQCEFSSGIIKKRKHYFFEKISDLYINSTNEKDLVNALLQNNKIVVRRQVNILNDRTEIIKSDTVLQNVFEPAFAFRAPNNFSFWKQAGKKLTLSSLTFNEPKSSEWVLFETSSDSTNLILNKSVKNSIEGRNYSIGYLSNEKETFVYLHDGTEFRKMHFPGRVKPKIKEEKYISYYNSMIKHKEYLSCYDETGNTFYFSDLQKNNNLLSGLFKNIYIKNYFVADFYLNELNLVYSDPIENCITIKRIE